MTGVLLRVYEHMESYSPSEQRVAHYILEHAQNTVGLTVKELAKKSGTSEASVIRFCKTIGFDGYRDFALQLATELAVQQNNDQPEYTDVSVGDSLQTIMQNIAYNNIKAIEKSLSLLSEEDVHRAVSYLNAARKIDFYGVGASGIVAQDGLTKFMRIGKVCTAYQDSHLQITSATTLTRQDVAIAISWSGNTVDVLKATRLAKENGAKIITMTKVGKNELLQYGDVNFQLSSPETSMRVGAMSSRIAQMTMIDILYSSVVSENYWNIRDSLDKTGEILGQQRAKHNSNRKNS